MYSVTRFSTLFYIKKTSPGPHTIWTVKNGLAKFFVFATIFAKTCACVHGVGVVDDYEDMEFLKISNYIFRFFFAIFYFFQRKIFYGVSVVTDYAYSMSALSTTTRTFWENLESDSLSQILKDQSGEKGTLVCLQTQ